MLICGMLVLLLTLNVFETEQPFAGFVTVKVYIPDEVTFVADAVGAEPAGTPVFGPVQEYAADGVDELPVNVTDEAEHVIT